jgi:NTP pyrophosphatase (non-canonical NTP hydrolase)
MLHHGLLPEDALQDAGSPSYTRDRMASGAEHFSAMPSPNGISRAPEDMTEDSLERLNQRLLAFAQARDWEQFHSPKNLVMALAGECGELLEHFQWLNEEQSASLVPEKKREVALEMADILIYLVRLSQRLDLDLLAAADEKIGINERRYPVEKVRGDARRADEYDR